MATNKIIKVWDVATVKEERPNVRVQIGRRTPGWARVFGRSHEVALVVPDSDPALCLEVPWGIVAEHVASGEAIQFEEVIRLKEPK